MRTLAIALTVLLVASTALAVVNTEYATEFRGPNRENIVFGYFDMSDATGFTAVDNTATAVVHFHVDSYMPFDGTDHWWCGNFDYDADGGYGNGWDDRLNIPATDVSAATYPVLTFAHYFSSELNWDFTYVQAKQAGAYIDLNSGYTGVITGGTWIDIGVYGFVLTGLDNPIEARFRFLSDGNTSDEDGLYASVGGGYMVDNIKIYDFYGGAVYFLDDVNSGGICVPTIPGSAGSWWHLVNDICSSNVVPSWWCGDDADTSLIPPNLDNALITPAVDISGALTCTVRYAVHAEVPSGVGDFWYNHVIVDGVDYNLGGWWGDFGQCGGFGTSGLTGDDISDLLPASSVQYMIIFYTDEFGCGPGTAGGAGINLDDTWFEGMPIVPVESSSWGNIKAMYR